jgi:tRNA(adenine34) deaminase
MNNEDSMGGLGLDVAADVPLSEDRSAINFSNRARDEAMMARCIELSRIAVSKSEYPFATVIAFNGKVVAEAINRTVREGDVTRHAEIIALSQAQKTVGRRQLRRCTLYSNVEPCAMCSYCIREVWLSRVVYAIGSPIMGGLSKWNILRDEGISGDLPQVFGAVPEVVSGVLSEEAQQAWRDWNPLAWELIKLRGFLADPSVLEEQVRVRLGHRWSPWHYLQLLFKRKGRSRTEADFRACEHSHL